MGTLEKLDKNVDPSTILIVSDDPAFSSAITAHWQSERHVPAFTLVSGDLCRGLDPDSFQLALIGDLRPDVLASVLKEIEVTGNPAVLISTKGRAALAPYKDRVIVVRQDGEWLETLVLVSNEILRRFHMGNTIRALKQANSTLERQATLGHYMLDMRHNLNNALTSVLGNAELLLLEPGSVSAEARGQLETIRNMSLRINEVLQRFSSLEKELKVIERQDGGEGDVLTRAAGAGAN